MTLRAGFVAVTHAGGAAGPKSPAFTFLGVLTAAALGCTAMSPNASGQTDAEFVPLFDGTLAGWTIENTEAGNIVVRDGVLRVEAPRGWLRSANRYRDFVLRTELRFVTDDADSGIFVRAVADSEFGPGWPGNSYQVQLRNPAGQSRFPPVGGVFRHGRPPGETQFDEALAAEAFTGTGEWQTLVIEVVGEELSVSFNGTLLTEAAGIVNSTGYIGIQAETGVVEFRSIEIDERPDPIAAR